MNESTQIRQDNRYGKIVSNQGERLIELENKNQKLNNDLINERAKRIEELKTIKYLAFSNAYDNEIMRLRKIAEFAGDKLNVITNGLIKKEKEPISNTDQSTKN